MRMQVQRELACQLSGGAVKRQRQALSGIGLGKFFSFLDHGGIFIGNSIQMVNGFLCRHRRRNYCSPCAEFRQDPGQRLATSAATLSRLCENQFVQSLAVAFDSRRLLQPETVTDRGIR